MSKIEVQLSEPQYEFLTSQAPVALFSAGLGCLHGDTLVDTVDGPTPIQDVRNNVISFDGQFFVPALSSAPILKGKAMLQRVIHEHGELLAHESHLFFCSDHRYRRADQAQAFLRSDLGSSPNLFWTNWDVFLSRSSKDVRRLTETIASCWRRYLDDCHQCGLQPLEDLDTYLKFVPLLTDALGYARRTYSHVFERRDDQAERAPARSHRGQSHGHQTSLGYEPRMGVPVDGAGDLLAALIVERTLLGNPQSQLFDHWTAHRHTMLVLHLGRTLVYALSRPYAVSKVLSVEKAHTDWYWDLQVPNLHNYVGSGLIHHNSGKSFIGAHWARNQVSASMAKGFIGANTYNQLQNATLATFFAVLDDLNVPYAYNRQRNIIKVAGRTVYAYSLENYNAIRGIEIGWAWLDETRDTPKAAFNVVLGRLRDRNVKRRLMRLTSTPNGFDWLYDEFSGPEKKPSYEVIFGRTQDNTFLPDGYAESLKESYDDKAYEQEVLGRFVNLTQGAIYYAFERDLQAGQSVERAVGVPVRIGIDFNVNPMSAVAFQDYDQTIHVLKDYQLMSSNTHELAATLIKDWGVGTEVIPDSTGKALKTASRGITDHQILREAGLVVLSNRNPARMDRYNCVNNLLEKGRLKIDKGCRALIRDLEKVSYKEGTNQPDTSDARLTHISDALGYACWHAYPIVKLSSGVIQIR